MKEGEAGGKMYVSADARACILRPTRIAAPRRYAIVQHAG